LLIEKIAVFDADDWDQNHQELRVLQQTPAVEAER
jgi:hypothetical protein